MRNTQKTLYKIGRIINWVLLGIYGLTFLINLIVLIVSAINDWYWIDELSAMITMVVLAAFVLVLVILDGKYGEQALTAPTDNLTPIILLMVFGLLSCNWLFLVGGVFGIIGASQEKNASEKKEEQPKEEPEQKAE